MDRQQRRANRRGGLEDDFRRHEERRAILLGKLESAKSVHAAAKAALLAAETALARASALYAGVEQDCTELQHLMALDPDTVNGLPVELLDAVFVALANEPDPFWPNIENAEYNEARALLPYRLAAVCRHWRTVALAKSALWTYVALPFYSVGRMKEKMSTLPAHVALQLQRSRSLAIDVCLDFNEHLDSHDPFTTCWGEVLSLVIDQACRWRRVTIRLPSPYSRFDQLMSPKDAPLLEELHLHGRAAVTDLSWISRAPSLRKLCLPDSPFNLPTTMSTVVSATVCGLYNVLRRMPHLESLSLIMYELPSAGPGPISLPALQSMKLEGGEDIFQRVLALAIVAPQLRRLHIDGGDLPRGAALSVQNFVRAFPSITDLEIEGRLSDGIADLALFSSVKRLTLVGPLVADVLYALIGGDDDTPSGRARVCPQLESLTVRNPSRALEYVLSPLAPFIWERAEACRARNAQFKASFESWPAWPKPPSWFRQLLGAALGPSNVRLTSSDGTTYDAVGDSDEEEEEAELTDPDESFTASKSDDESEDYDSDGVAQVMRVNGSDWETDSDDMDYVDEGD